MGKHEIVHVELSSSNPGASSQFYSDLFGWKPVVMPEFDYYSFDIGNGTGGGFNSIREANGPQFAVKPGDVIVYVSTGDIEASLGKAEELGGRVILPKTEIPQMGWYAIFADPTGNQVGLFTGMPQPEAATA